MKNQAVNLFLLTANLSQLKDRDRIITLFIESMNAIYTDLAFNWADNPETGPANQIEICTRKGTYGFINYSGQANLEETTAALIHNACQMLGVILEKLTQEQLLIEQNKALEILAEERALLTDKLELRVAERTAALEKANSDLTASRQAALKMMEDAVKAKQHAEETSVALQREIAERKQVEESLRTSQQLTEGIINTIPVRVFWKDKNLIYLGCNEIFARDAGFAAPKDIIGKDDYQMGWRDQAELYRGDDRQVIESGVSKISIEEPQTTPTGSTITLLTSKIPLRDPKGEISGVLGTYMDITERKRAEEEREKLQAQLVQAQKMESVGRLAGGVAHDFNNMLLVILGHAELALRQVSPANPIHNDLDQIHKAAQRSADLTRQLLAFARKQAITPQILNLNETVSGMLKMLQRLIGEDIALVWHPGANLWPVRMDPTQIDQIMANLAVNARDAIAGVGNLAIETENITLDTSYCALHAGTIPGDYVRLAVSDTGVGMSREVLTHLFEPFFTTKDVGKGTGLGLATIYGIVKQNNGHINVYSEPGHGTIFRIYLPRHIDKTAPIKKESPAEAATGGSETILLVEDELAILAMSKIMLEQFGYRVLAARTPGEAIHLAKEHAGEIHLLMTDVVMPEMNGRDLAKQLLSLYPNLKRLFMSGYTADVIAHRGIVDESIAFIQKPFSIKDMAAKVREVLDHHHGV